MKNQNSRFRILHCVLALAVTFCLVGQAKCQNDKKHNDSTRIPGKVLRLLQNDVIPALELGDHNSAVQVLKDILHRSNPAVVNMINQLLEEKGFASATSLFADHILQLVRQGDPSLSNQPSVTQLKLLTPEFQARVKNFLTKLDASEVLAGQADLPRDWDDAEKFFWQFHVAKNEIDSHIKLVNFGQQISKPFLDSQSSINQEPQLAAKLREFGVYAVQLHETGVNLVKTEAKYRLTQLENSIDEIDAAKDFRSKFIALTSLRSAKVFFDEFFETHRQEFGDAAAAQAFAEKVAKKITLAEGGNKDVVEKVDLFQQGLHWWFRGRYGAGPLAAGLLKPSSALKNSNTMFGLFMPRNRPIPPTKPTLKTTGEGELPYYERRHYHTWPIGHRDYLDLGQKPTKDMRIRVEVTTNGFY